MNYFSLLNLDREPFSNSPDPDFFFQSQQHVACLQKLELALRLKRGLNIVIGPVGSGKTTLCRTLLKQFAADSSVESHLVLDPAFNSPAAFLENIGSMIVDRSQAGGDAYAIKEAIKQHLYKKGVEASQTVILIIDEGQKLPVFSLEILRELLNYETNAHKLLQIVIFAQEEFQETLARHANLADRVNLLHCLGPMGLADTHRMIHFRIRRSSGQPRPPALFSKLALLAIYRATGGYPRKVINLCHQCLLALIIQNRRRVGWRLVRSCTARSLAQGPRSRRTVPLLATSALLTVAAILLVYIRVPGGISSILVPTTNHDATALPEKTPSSSPPLPIGAPPAAPPSSVTDPAQPILAAVQSTDVQTAPPVLLGAVTVQPDDTLGRMVTVIYGDSHHRYFKAVLDANPHIGHADAIRLGDRIVFPAVATTYSQRAYPLWWLRVDAAGSLEEAFRRAVKISASKEGPRMRIVSAWDRQRGLRYELFVFGYFFSPSAAETMKAKLPHELSETAEIQSGWATDALLFADPFAGKAY